MYELGSSNIFNEKKKLQNFCLVTLYLSTFFDNTNFANTQQIFIYQIFKKKKQHEKNRRTNNYDKKFLIRFLIFWKFLHYIFPFILLLKLYKTWSFTNNRKENFSINITKEHENINAITTPIHTYKQMWVLHICVK